MAFRIRIYCVRDQVFKTPVYVKLQMGNEGKRKTNPAKLDEKDQRYWFKEDFIYNDWPADQNLTVSVWEYRGFNANTMVGRVVLARPTEENGILQGKYRLTDKDNKPVAARIGLEIVDEQQKKKWEAEHPEEVQALEQARKEKAAKKIQAPQEDRERRSKQQEINDIKSQLNLQRDYVLQIKSFKGRDAFSSKLFFEVYLGDEKKLEAVTESRVESSDTPIFPTSQSLRYTTEASNYVLIILWDGEGQEGSSLIGQAKIQHPDTTTTTRWIPFVSAWRCDCGVNNIPQSEACTACLKPRIKERESHFLPNQKPEISAREDDGKKPGEEGDGKDESHAQDDSKLPHEENNAYEDAAELTKSEFAIKNTDESVTDMQVEIGVEVIGPRESSSSNPAAVRQWLPDKLYHRDFEYMSILGKGSFGRVVRVRYKPKKDDPNFPQFAMKVISKKKIVSDNDVRTEIEVMTKLSGHPFIVQIQQHFENDRHIHVVMELVRGGSLDEVLKIWKKQKQTKSLQITHEQMVRFWAAEIVMALGQMHAANIVYRDLKPDNVLLDEHGHIRLCDLGVAFQLGTAPKEPEESEKPDMTEERQPSLEIGGHGYKAPEMLKGQVYGCAVDWWSLGIVLHLLLTGGKHPFGGLGVFGNRDRAASKVVSAADIKDIKSISPVANDLVHKLLEPDPKKRLGGGDGGFGDVMAHPFFDNINWQLLQNARLRGIRIMPAERELQIIKPAVDEKPEFKDLYDAMETIDQRDVSLQLALQVGIQ